MRDVKCWLGILTALLLSCGEKKADGPGDTYDEGTVHISVDESFKPVIDSEIEVFQSHHPKARIIAHYKPEADCIRDFRVDSIRMVIATRPWSAGELAFLNDSMNVSPSYMTVAFDAVAVIVHPSSPDSTFTMKELKDLLAGRSKKNLVPVFDGKSATSTVRFIIDSVLRKEGLGPQVVAAQGSEEVINYVARTPNAVGLIGVSWIGNSQDSGQLKYRNMVKVAGVEHPMVPGVFARPTQKNIHYRSYPLLRDLVYILKEKHRVADFLTTQSGQLIFNRAFLEPAYMKFVLRDATLHTDKINN
jgi:phosphate transport system substrate-binding protein